MSADRERAIAWLLRMLLVVLGSVCGLPGQTQDIFDTERSVPLVPASPMMDGTACPEDSPSGVVTLKEAVERTLCGHPKSRQAWAGVKQQAASKGVALAAFLPTVTISGQIVTDSSKTAVDSNPFLNASNSEWPYTASASLAWLLYDFGGREAALDNADESLAAALENHNDVLRTLFAAAAKDYYSTLAAQGALNAAIETEQSARDSQAVAIRKVEKGIAPITDQFQAETAYLQAKITHQKAEGDLRSALGLLASDMAIRPDSDFRLPAIGDREAPVPGLDRSVSILIDSALHRHPKILMAEAQLKSAEAAARQARAAGLPSLSLIAKSTRDDHGIAAAQGLPLNPATTQDNYVGLEVSFPLFEGFSRHYKVKEAEAEREQQAAALDDARRQVSLDVWTSYYALLTAKQNLDDSNTLLDIAQRSYSAALRRYETGAGPMIELLNTQSTLAGARRQRVQAWADWHTSRLDLASKLGSLELADSDEPDSLSRESDN